METAKADPQRRVMTHGIILVTPQHAIRIAGLSVLQRTTFALERAGIHLITLMALGEASRSLAVPLTRASETRVRWGTPEELPETIEGDVLLLLRPVVIDPAAVEALSELGNTADPVLALDVADPSGKLIDTGAFFVAGRALAETMRCLIKATRALDPHGTFNQYARATLPRGICYPVGSGSETSDILAAEKMLLGSLRRNTDGFFAYWLDRRISTAISRYLVRSRVTPNQISVFTLVPALVGAVLVALPGTFLSGLGTILYLISTILDGCDGEVARLKYLESARGARLDLLCDNLGLIALFLGIIVHASSEITGAQLLWAIGAVIGGLVAASVIEYLLIARPRIRHGGNGLLTPNEVRRRELYERLASRDFAYLLPVAAFTGTLSWFLWATALGVNLFWIALVTIVVRKPAATCLSGASMKLRP